MANNNVWEFCDLSSFWVLVLIASVVGMTAVFMYTLNDYTNSPIVIDVDLTISNKHSAFPAVSVCIQRLDIQEASTERVRNFVQKYYAEHNIEEPNE